MSNIKVLRGQVRQVVKEILPEVMNNEQFDVLRKQIDERISKLEKEVKDMMSEMNARHKDVMSYLVRNVSTPLAPKKD